MEYRDGKIEITRYPEGDGYRPFDFACSNGMLRAAKWLFAHGAAVAFDFARQGRRSQIPRPIEQAFRGNHWRCVLKQTRVKIKLSGSDPAFDFFFCGGALRHLTFL